MMQAPKKTDTTLPSKESQSNLSKKSIQKKQPSPEKSTNNNSDKQINDSNEQGNIIQYPISQSKLAQSSQEDFFYQKLGKHIFKISKPEDENEKNYLFTINSEEVASFTPNTISENAATTVFRDFFDVFFVFIDAIFSGSLAETKKTLHITRDKFSWKKLVRLEMLASIISSVEEESVTKITTSLFATSKDSTQNSAKDKKQISDNNSLNIESLLGDATQLRFNDEDSTIHLSIKDELCHIFHDHSTQEDKVTKDTSQNNQKALFTNAVKTSWEMFVRNAIADKFFASKGHSQIEKTQYLQEHLTLYLALMQGLMDQSLNEHGEEDLEEIEEEESHEEEFDAHEIEEEDESWSLFPEDFGGEWEDIDFDSEEEEEVEMDEGEEAGEEAEEEMEEEVGEEEEAGEEVEEEAEEEVGEEEEQAEEEEEEAGEEAGAEEEAEEEAGEDAGEEVDEEEEEVENAAETATAAEEEAAEAAAEETTKEEPVKEEPVKEESAKEEKPTKETASNKEEKTEKTPKEERRKQTQKTEANETKERSNATASTLNLNLSMSSSPMLTGLDSLSSSGATMGHNATHSMNLSAISSEANQSKTNFQTPSNSNSTQEFQPKKENQKKNNPDHDQENENDHDHSACECHAR